MEDLSKTLAARHDHITEKLIPLTAGTRRTEITIERETYSLEILGAFPTSQDTRCPACGHTIPVLQPSLDSVINNPEAIAKIILAKTQSFP